MFTIAYLLIYITAALKKNLGLFVLTEPHCYKYISRMKPSFDPRKYGNVRPSCRVLHGQNSLQGNMTTVATLISLINMEVGINMEGVQKLPNH